MPEHLLDASQVGTAFEEVRRERVPQEMRVHAPGLEPGAVGEPAEDEECPRAGQRAAARVEEEVGTVTTVEVRSSQRHVPSQRVRRWAPERHDPLLPALADDADDALLEVDGRLDEPDRL